MALPSQIKNKKVVEHGELWYTGKYWHNNNLKENLHSLIYEIISVGKL